MRKIYILIVIFFGLVVTQACSQNKTNEHFENGKTFMANADFATAILEFSNAIQINPNYKDAYIYRGLLYSNIIFNVCEFDLGIADFTSAIALDNNNAEIYTMRGEAYKNKGEYFLAIDDFNRAINIDPNYLNAYVERGRVYIEIYDNPRAIDDFTKAISISPDRAWLYSQRADSYNRNNDFNNAIIDINEAIRLDPQHGRYYYERAFIYECQALIHGTVANFDKIIDDYTIAIEYSDDFERAEIYSSRALAYSNKYGTDNRSLEFFNFVIADYEAALSLRPYHEQARIWEQLLNNYRALRKRLYNIE